MAWLPWWLRLMLREPKRPAGHPLLTHMREATVDDVREMLARRRPTPEECDALVAEEMTDGWERESVLALLRACLPDKPKKPWVDPDPRGRE